MQRIIHLLARVVIALPAVFFVATDAGAADVMLFHGKTVASVVYEGAAVMVTKASPRPAIA